MINFHLLIALLTLVKFTNEDVSPSLYMSAKGMMLPNLMHDGL